jgi:hypothetical protein
MNNHEKEISEYKAKVAKLESVSQRRKRAMSSQTRKEWEAMANYRRVNICGNCKFSQDIWYCEKSKGSQGINCVCDLHEPKEGCNAN